jgi:hypothetical protein
MRATVGGKRAEFGWFIGLKENPAGLFRPAGFFTVKVVVSFETI